MEIISGRQPRRPRLVVYGTEGVGKSTLAAKSGGLILDCEGGTGYLDCDRLQPPTSWLEFKEQLAFAARSEYPWLIVDTIDFCEERLLWPHVVEQAGVNTIEEVGGGYGKGYRRAAEEFGKLLDWLDKMREATGKGVVLLAHSVVERYEPPGEAAYDRHNIALHKQTRALLAEWSDATLFAHLKAFTTTEDAGFGKERNVVVDANRRVLLTTSKPHAIAKSRFDVPDELPLEWSAISKAFGESNGKPGNIAGIVKDGSSKGSDKR